MNRVVLRGRVLDSVFSISSRGLAVLRVRLETRDHFTSPYTGRTVERYTVHPVIVFGSLAERLRRRVYPGLTLQCTGSLHHRVISGTPRSSVVAYEVKEAREPEPGGYEWPDDLCTDLREFW